MPMNIVIANPQVLNVLAKDIQDLARDVAGHKRLRKAWERVRDEVNIPSIAQNFAREGRPQKWEPVAPATEDRSPNRKAILDVTGQLKRSATAKARFHIRDNQMTYGDWPTRRWWGPVHDFGSDDGFIPQRQFVLIQQPEDVNQIAEILMEWVEDRVNDNIKMHYV